LELLEKRVLPFFRLIRLPNLFIIALTQYVSYVFLPVLIEGEIVCKHLPFLDSRLFLMISATVCIAAAGNVINDYFDIKIDLINKKHKVIISRNIGRRTAIVLHIFLNLVGIVIGFALSWKVGMFMAAMSFILVMYSATFKRWFLIGNVVIASLLSLAIFVLWLMNPALVLKWILWYMAFAFINGLIREIIKDIEDVEGDKTYGCQTLPVLLGIKKTRNVLKALFLGQLFFLIAFVIDLILASKSIAAVFLLLSCGLFGACTFYKFLQASSKSDYSQVSFMMKMVMLAGILSIILNCVRI